jgi:4-hydroxy-2-oxoheptanedioate aldolase
VYQGRTTNGDAGSPASLRALLEGGRATAGGWCAIPDSLSAQVMAGAGFDWVCLDTQHGLIDRAAMVAMLTALDAHGVPSLVRVPANDGAAIMAALDAGADGVIVPLVNSAAEAAAAVDACRYPPLGHRSWGPVRASLRQPGYAPATANADVLCIPMIETVDAVDAVEEICAVPGVDALFVGPWDLSLSATSTIETPGRKPVDQELIGRVAAAARAAGVHLGIACASAEEAGDRSRQGFALLALLSDVALLGRAATDVVAAARPLLADVAPQPAP